MRVWINKAGSTEMSGAVLLGCRLAPCPGWLAICGTQPFHLGCPVRSLELPDKALLQAAQGWLELGCPCEARAELQRMAAPNRRHPDALQVMWRVCAKEQRWSDCLAIATRLTQITPERRFGWLHQAMALHKLGRTNEAIEVLLEIRERFEPNTTIPYYLACYYCSLGRIHEAKDWLEDALNQAETLEELNRLKQRASSEPLLAPVRTLVDLQTEYD